MRVAKFTAGLVGAGLLASVLVATAQDNQMKIVVGFAAGGVSDILARIYAEELKTRLKRTVIVENRAGGSGTIAIGMVSRAAPDGNTLTMITGTHTLVPALQKLSYDPATALTPINLIASAPNLLVAKGDATYGDLKSLITNAKASPGVLAYASSGVGTPGHFMALLLEKDAGIKLNHIPFKSSGESLQAVIGGHVPMSFSALNSVLPALKSGEVKALAIASERRSELAPDVPTFAELGYPGVKSDTWFGLAGPAGMPADQVAKVNDAVVESLKTPEMRKKIIGLGADIVGAGPGDFNRVIQTELANYERLAREAGLRKN